MANKKPDTQFIVLEISRDKMSSFKRLLKGQNKRFKNTLDKICDDGVNKYMSDFENGE